MNVKLEELNLHQRQQTKYPYSQKWLSSYLRIIPFRMQIMLQGELLADNYPDSSKQISLILNFAQPGLIKKLFLKHDPLILAEAYIKGLLDVKGELEYFLSLGSYFAADNGNKVPLPVLLEVMLWPDYKVCYSQSFASSMNKHSLTRDKLSIQHHYDVGNDFYKLWLDPKMVYSCAHFDNSQTTLAEAQEAKLDLICRKLQLKKDDTLLDVGCGWGALLKWAAVRYGVKAHGITLSQEQLTFNKQWIAKENLCDQVSVELLDYRDLPSSYRFDKIVSIGMIEHVGIKNYDLYFSILFNILNPNGLLLNHGIVTQTKWDPNGPAERFIDRYIFPSGELAPLSTIIKSIENTNFEVADIDSWRPHYALTLRTWFNNLKKNYNQALSLVGPEKLKLWELYLLGSATGFENNHLGVCQVLARRRCDRHWNEPLTRSGWLC